MKPLMNFKIVLHFYVAYQFKCIIFYPYIIPLFCITTKNVYKLSLVNFIPLRKIEVAIKIVLSPVTQTLRTPIIGAINNLSASQKQ